MNTILNFVVGPLLGLAFILFVPLMSIIAIIWVIRTKIKGLTTRSPRAILVV